MTSRSTIDWLYEIKWDGYRAIAFLDGDVVRLVSRNQNDLTTAYPELSSRATSERAPRSSTAKLSRSTSKAARRSA